MEKNRIGLNTFDRLPEEMENYLQHNGYHFNKKAYEYACRFMKKKKAGSDSMERIQPVEKAKVEDLLKKYNVQLENDMMYDSSYVYSMAMADFYGKSIPDEKLLAMHIKDRIDDVDKPDGYIFNEWYADMCFAGIPIDWLELI